MIAALAVQTNRLGIKSALVTNMFMNVFSGSPIVALDVAMTLKEAGVDVTIASASFQDPILSKVTAAGVKMIDLSIPDAKQSLAKSYDLIWGQHWPIYDLVLCALETHFRYLAFSCLSPYEPLESISPCWQMADRLLFNSPETLEKAAPPDATKIEVLPNSLPALWRDGWSMPAADLHRIAIVSNNLVRDLEEAVMLLRAQGIEVEQIGLHSRQRDADPALIDSFDAVVTIGHSVQKALMRRRPVYIYDRFGGFGWLTPDNAKDALELNFSGRGHGRLKGALIAQTITEGYARAAASALNLATWAGTQFDLEINLARVLSSFTPAPREKRITSDTCRHQAAAARLVINLQLRRAIFNPVHELYPPRRIQIHIGPTTSPSTVEIFWPRKIDGCYLATEHDDVIVQGALILRAPHRIARIFLRTHNAIVEGKHGLASVHLRAVNSDDERYLAAKFEIPIPSLVAKGSGIIEVYTEDGKQITIAPIEFTLLDDS